MKGQYFSGWMNNDGFFIISKRLSLWQFGGCHISILTPISHGAQGMDPRAEKIRVDTG